MVNYAFTVRPGPFCKSPTTDIPHQLAPFALLPKLPVAQQGIPDSTMACGNTSHPLPLRLPALCAKTGAARMHGRRDPPNTSLMVLHNRGLYWPVILEQLSHHQLPEMGSQGPRQRNLCTESVWRTSTLRAQKETLKLVPHLMQSLGHISWLFCCFLGLSATL